MDPQEAKDKLFLCLRRVMDYSTAMGFLEALDGYLGAHNKEIFLLGKTLEGRIPGGHSIKIQEALEGIHRVTGGDVSFKILRHIHRDSCPGLATDQSTDPFFCVEIKSPDFTVSDYADTFIGALRRASMNWDDIVRKRTPQKEAE